MNQHENLLKNVSVAIQAFFKDLGAKVQLGAGLAAAQAAMAEAGAPTGPQLRG